jgi:asparagine synthase (glutamine-hydrolysing)
MCGIAGELQRGGREAVLADLERANQRQRTRGPDSGGFYQLGNMAFGHRRLKIFDLSDKAAQPMVDTTLGLALVYNGAIYNFHDLREELQGMGYRFISTSDTEVVMKAYHAWGTECVSRLHGMFAFAIWERESGRMILARDRLGIKPLYYADTPESFRFASSVSALLAYREVDRSIDPDALHHYLTFHAVPEPMTILKGVRKVMPGTVMIVNPDGTREETRYWQMSVDEAKTNQLMSEKDWLEATREALTLATDRQLEADVPVGILLSGGLDSSLLVALAHKAGKQLKTFSIGFETVGDEAGDEFHYSDMVAKHFGTEHFRLFMSNAQLLGSLEECVRSMSEPMISHDNIGFYLLAKEVSKHVKVVLSGQGADEMLAGYHWFQTLAALPDHADGVAYYAQHVLDRSYEEYRDAVTEEYRTENLSAAFLRRTFAENGAAKLVDNVLQFDSTFALANGPLGRVDNMTMASSLEARVPFLDELFVELSANMPLKYKLPDGGKYILKQLGRTMLPREVVDRPKGYFPVPALKYLEGPQLQLMRDVLSPESVRKRGIFNPQMVQGLLDDPQAHLTPLGGSKLWQIGLLEYWLQLQDV